MKEHIKQAITDRIRDNDARNSAWGTFAYWLLSLVYLELLLHIVAFGAPDLRFTFAAGFSFLFACVLALLTTFLPQTAQLPATIIFTVTLIVLYGSQMVYNFVFGTLYSVALMQQGGAAITSFWKEMLLTIWENLHWLLALFFPVLVLILLRIFRGKVFGKTNGFWRTTVVLTAVAAQFTVMHCLQTGGTGYFSNYYFYHSESSTTNQTAERFGLLTAFRLDLFGSEEAIQADMGSENSYYVPEESTEQDPHGTEGPTEPAVEYNVLNIDFDALNGLTTDETILSINNYCASLTGTNKNEYTGMLSDYNLIVICAESFASGAIDKELTPTLYRLANEGIIFNNYYNTYPNTTTDGEYSLCMGLYPDTTRKKAASSFYASRNSYLPFCLGNVFTEQLGIQSYGYHNYYGSYYGRDESHPNMGYSMKFASDGMHFTTSWPASDLEMMEQSVDDYIRADEPFHAYYMTFSGHYKYDTSINPMASRNWDAVAGLDYSEESRSYLSCNIELDKALEYLMQRLEAEGIADKTAIVLAGDHFPYGLTDSQYSELVGYTIDDFTKFKSTLIFWVGGLEENIVVDEYCCNVDILPTILNLWGFEYDSRMLAGTDVFSDGEHMAVLIDKSFFNDKVWVNASTGEIRYLVEESQLPAGYVEHMLNLIQTRFSLCADILNTAYYNFIFEQGNVTVNRNSWREAEKEDTHEEELPEADEIPENYPGVFPEIPSSGTQKPETTPSGPSADTQEPETDPDEPAGDFQIPEDFPDELPQWDAIIPDELPGEIQIPETPPAEVPNETTAP